MNIIVTGGHSGDETIMAGALIHKYTRLGHKVVIVSLTTGDGGHPTLSRDEYRNQKEEEALKAAGILGAETRIFPCSSGMLDVSVKVKEELASIIEEIKPQAIITHWKNSIHPDHAAAHYNTIGAMLKAKMGKIPLFFAENWEDSTEFNPDIAVKLEQEDFDAWLKAAEAFQFFREGFYNYPYRQYYKNLFFNRGAVTGNGPCASVLMRHKYQGEFIKTELPGTEA